jgi:hypothetical protein
MPRRCTSKAKAKLQITILEFSSTAAGDKITNFNPGADLPLTRYI